MAPMSTCPGKYRNIKPPATFYAGIENGKLHIHMHFEESKT